MLESNCKVELSLVVSAWMQEKDQRGDSSTPYFLILALGKMMRLFEEMMNLVQFFFFFFTPGCEPCTLSQRKKDAKN